jgi:hypothetical protein
VLAKSPLRERSWFSPACLRPIAGRGRQFQIEVGSDSRTDSWAQKLMNFDAFLLRVQPHNKVLYLARYDLFKQLPALADDISKVLLVLKYI